MAGIPVEVKNIINKFIDNAIKNNIELHSVYLFGSFAKGTNHKWSDIDLAVISDDFEGIRFYDRLKLAKTKIETSSSIETHTYRKEDFTLDNPFVGEILSHAIKVYEKH